MLHTTNASEDAPATRYLAGSLLQLLLRSPGESAASEREAALASAARGPGLVA
jgi:hypothetical protein